MREWAQQARAALDRAPTALVTVLATEGSAPRGPGARMVVTPDGLHGSIGGGALEYQAVEQARAILGHAVGAWRIQDYPLGPLLGQCCGGRVRLMIEHLDPGASQWIERDAPVVTRLLGDRTERTGDPGEVPPLSARGERPEAFVEPSDVERLAVLMFGAGHVGRAIARKAADLPLHFGWYDPRPDAADTPGVVLAADDAMVACAASAPRDAAVLILTHDHALDYRLTAAALGSDARFVGLIGSQTKRARFLSRLARDGIDATRLTCPIGVPGITGKEPEIIAIATLAQLLTLRDAA
ncbi:MAG: xanthine dehydrogenase accessory protein XdhC [Sphingomonas sp.]|uniref:xanthine dehydrogenase accessory protein XdhC n=1 Tax=Sphingomonas sp. TaxID=28214 RepID=UPI0012169576|nr:xanthine dehydrogenase accessory protein XdhC [Sphingomonas sp.]THD37282.1 MAG: xanthine dehydrogenase accessory protein XdhC [Sphingomonas sp.]